jgi:hypothetical protein
LERDVPQSPPVVSFGLLGPLEVHVGGRALLIPNGKLRTLLAALLLRANETVPLRELSEALWGEVQPVDPRSTIQKYVMRLRRLLEPTGSAIRTDVEGYRLDVRPDQLDVQRFVALAQRGRRLVEAGEWTAASRLLNQATGLWRAVSPLGNVSSELVHRDDVPFWSRGTCRRWSCVSRLTCSQGGMHSCARSCSGWCVATRCGSGSGSSGCALCMPVTGKERRSRPTARSLGS